MGLVVVLLLYSLNFLRLKGSFEQQQKSIYFTAFIE